jgi:GH25 family lysozyme M1 (1,4-beta-N-acetylmuramidase)
MSKITCVDISEFQQNIDFNKMKNDGIKAVIIRAGYGRETSQKDTMFESHYRNAKEAGLKIGAYWYSYADSVDDAEKEAKACLECVENKYFDMPIYYDLEDNSIVKLGKAKLTEIAERFCETIKKSNYRAGVYANLNWFNNYLDYDKLKKKYSIWLAQYNSVNELNCDIWQNSSTGRVSGYNGRLDTNVIYNEDIFSGKSDTKVEKPTLTYRVYADGKWYNEVKGLSNVAGRKKQAISAVAVKVSKGNIKYRVHLLNGDWLPWVDGYDINDSNNGYAGIKGKVIDAIQVEFSGVGDYKATYRVRKQRAGFWDWQHNTEKNSEQDGYAGLFGTKIDGLQITLT